MANMSRIQDARAWISDYMAHPNRQIAKQRIEDAYEHHRANCETAKRIGFEWAGEYEKCVDMLREAVEQINAE